MDPRKMNAPPNVTARDLEPRRGRRPGADELDPRRGNAPPDVGPSHGGIGPRQPVIKMPPTSFNSQTVAPATVQIVGATPWPQRVLLYHATLGSQVFVAESQAAIDIEAPAPVRSGAYALPAVAAQVLTVGPNQPLYAASDGAPVLLAVSASAAIPFPKPEELARARGMRIGDTEFGSYVLGVGVTTHIVGGLSFPRRVVAQIPGTGGFLASSTGNPLADAFTVPAFGGLNPPMTFVLAPDQPLYASLAPGSPPAAAGLSVAVSDIPILGVRGPTGIAGPDGQE